MSTFRVLAAFLVALVIGVASRPVLAGQYEDGKAAFNKGAYSMALKLWKPLLNRATPWLRAGANKGDARSKKYLALLRKQ